METVELVVKIPKELYNATQTDMYRLYTENTGHIVLEAIKNGIILPKGHGKLVDADKAVNDYTNYGISHMWDATDLPYIMDECPVVLEADKEMSE